MSTLAAPGLKEFALRIAGRRHTTETTEFLLHMDELVRDPAIMPGVLREANASGVIPEAHRSKFFGRVAIAGEAEVQLALQAAHEASKAYGRASHAERKRLVMAIGRAIEANREELAQLGTFEGRPRMTFEWEFNHHYEEKGTFREEVLDYYLQQLDGERINQFDRLTYFPYGVVGFIPPGNAPIYNSLAGIIGALIAGNALVVKPPRNRAVQTLRFVEICDEVATEHGFPGLLNTVVGDSRQIVEMWANSPLVDVVVYYGGSGLGMDIGAKLTKKYTKPVLELAGSDPVVVWKDADINAAANAIFLTRYFVNAGQICVAPKRLFVHREIYDAVAARLQQLVRAEWVIDLPGRIDTSSPFLLPVFDMDRKLCIATLADAAKRGRPILAGGRWLDHTGRENPDGLFLEPTLIGGVSMEDHCMRHEIFGPVLPIMAIDSLEEAITHSNDTIYGLRASIWTNSVDVAEAYCAGVRTGSVFVNDHSLHFNGKAPYIGGIKASGFTGAKYFHLELSIRRYIHHGRQLPFYHFNTGMDHVKHQRLKDAALEFEKAIAMDAGFAFGYFGRGLCLRRTGRLEEGIAALQHAIALKGDWAEFHYELGLAQLAADRPDEAVAALMRTLALEASHVNAHVNLGWVLMHLGRHAEAAEAYRAFLRLADDPGRSAQVQELLARCEAALSQG